jgi:hypothetical protein
LYGALSDLASIRLTHSIRCVIIILKGAPMARHDGEVLMEAEQPQEKLVECEDAPIPTGYRAALAFAILLVLAVLAFALRN